MTSLTEAADAVTDASDADPRPDIDDIVGVDPDHLSGIIEDMTEHAPDGVEVWLQDTTPSLLAMLTVSGHRYVEDPAEAQCAVVSTRGGKHRVAEAVAIAAAHGLPIAVVTHPGGERLAVEAIRLGALVVLAEGDMSALGPLARGETESELAGSPLVEAYEARIGRLGGPRSASAATSAVTGLPTEQVLTARLAALADDPDRPMRLVAMRLLHLSQATTRMSQDAVNLLYRRIAASFVTVCAKLGQLYDLGTGAFLLVAPGLSVESAERLGLTMSSITEAYTPDAHNRLLLAVGHAGIECGSDPLTLRELASRAEGAAALEDSSTVVGAGELVGPLATATQLEVTMRLVELAESMAGDGPRRVEVAYVASEIATAVGLDPGERSIVRMVAHVSEIGRVTIADPVASDREHPVAGAKLLASTAGAAVAAGVRHHHEQWDGGGFPDGLTGNAIPAAARITAVADALVRYRYDVTQLRADAGIRFDPTLVDAVEDLVRDGVLHR
jgi:GGDEF domain-containing protein